jgi:hypothetical protein
MFDIPMVYLPFIIGLIIPIAIAILVLWFVVLKQKFLTPLPNEHDEGIWQIPLPQLGRMNEGRVTTARRTIQEHYAKLIDNASVADRENLIQKRDSTLKFHIFAQLVGRDKIIYLFDKNPLDPENHMRHDKSVKLGADIPVRFITNVKDCMSIGKGNDGFEYIGVKLGSEQSYFTPDEREQLGVELEALKVLKLAATNVEAIKHYKDLADDRETLISETLSNVREIASQRDTAKRALSQKSLLEPETPQVKAGFLRAVAKSWGWYQVAVAALAYILTPNIMKALEISYPEPTTVALGVAIGAFFLAPFVRGLVKR